MVMPRYSHRVHPWKEWTSSSAPDWWTNGYNKIKHDRMNYPAAPTMIRAIGAVSALQVLLLHYYRLRFGDCMLPNENAPALLHPLDEGDPWLGTFIGWSWRLPGEGAT